MKKRILALALAGTTAFSVFGATLSVNAAAPTGWPVDSAHTISTNDVYKAYEPVAVSIDTSYTGATQTLKYTEVKNAYVHTSKGAETETYVLTSSQNDAQKVPGCDATENITGTIWVNTNTKTVYVKNVHADDISKFFSEATIQIGELGSFTVDTATDTSSFENGNGYVRMDTPFAAIIKENAPVYKFVTGKDAEQYPLGELTALTGKYYFDGTNVNTLYCVDEISSETELLKKAGIAVKKVSASDLYNTTDAKLDIDITSKFDNYALANWTFDGSTSSETTIYPWTVDTRYVVNPDGDIEVKVTEAVSTPTVYLFDFLPFNGTNINSATVATKYNAVVAARTALAADPDNAVLIAAAQKAEADFAATVGNVDWVAETGDGSSYGIRAEVVDEYED